VELVGVPVAVVFELEVLGEDELVAVGVELELGAVADGDGDGEFCPL
jgi:hypothetical protein